MPISHKKRIIFIHIPKNAGTSIISSKELQFSPVSHKNFQQYINEFPSEWKSYLKVSIVRNPWDRFVSCYEYARMLKSYWHSNDEQSSLFGPHPDHLIIKNLQFNDFIEKFADRSLRLQHPCWVPQNSWIFQDNKIMVDKVFKFEEIKYNNEFKNLFGQIETLNKSTRTKKDYREYYSKKSIEIIENEYKKDIEVFGYKF